jgi:hypothetical protein
MFFSVYVWPIVVCLMYGQINYHWFTCPYYVFHLTLTISCYYFVKHHPPVAICYEQKLCSKWGNSCILNMICTNYAHVLIHQTVIAAVRFRSQAGPRGICGGQIGTGTGVSPSASVSALSLSIHQCPILIWLLVGGVTHKAKSRNLPKKVKFLELMDHQGGTVIKQFAFGLPFSGWL